MFELDERPGESRGFVHRRFGRAIRSLATTGSPIAAIGTFVTPPAPRLLGQPPVTVMVPSTQACIGTRKFDPRTGACERPSSIAARNLKEGNLVTAAQAFLPGGATGLPVGPQGEAMMGRYGAAMVPLSITSARSDCSFGGAVRGMILGDDGLCYNSSQISNKERKWPKGRAPLLTGGEMRAISTAARAAGRLNRTSKRLDKVGKAFSSKRR